MKNKYEILNDESICLGMSLTIEALKHSSKYIKDVFISTKACKNEQLSYLLKLCDENNINPIYDDNIIDKLSLKENCYCIAIFKRFYNNLKTNKHIVLYGFNDYGELGTTLRSAVSFDYKDIILIDCKIDYFDCRCVRSSMGAIFHTNILSLNTIEEYLNLYPKQLIIPFVSNGKKELKQLNVNENYSLIISQDYYALDNKFLNGYYLNHKNINEISLSLRTAIIFNYIYTLNLKR